MRCVSWAAYLALVLAVPASAVTAPPAATSLQAPAPTVRAQQRIRGTIDTYDPATRLLIVLPPGTKAEPVTVTLTADARIVYDQRRKVSDLKPGDFVGAAAIKGTDGKLHAQQVVVFPDSLHGTGEGQYPTGDATPNRLMTNATVAQVTSVAANSGTVSLTYRGAAAGADGTCAGHASAAQGGQGCAGSAEIVIPPGVPVIGLMLGDETLLVPGAAVSLIATPSSEDALQSARITVEKDGVKPIP
jgi:hypothetical protein